MEKDQGELYVAINKHMSQKDIQINFKLSGDFNSYVIKHPEVLRSAGAEDSCIVFVDPARPALSRKNLELAEKITKEEKKKCFKAIKARGKWKLEPVE